MQVFHFFQQWSAKWNFAIYAYALMTNHVHLLLTPKVSGAPSELMQSLGRRYVQYANRFYKRTGSLWEGRYKSSVVQAETYLLSCMRYIELNPVKAAMVVDPGQYRWSSYRPNGLSQPDSRLTPHALYLALDTDAQARCTAYRALFRPELDEEAASDIREAMHLSMPLGNDRFADAICSQLGIRRNSGRRGRSPQDGKAASEMKVEQSGFGF